MDINRRRLCRSAHGLDRSKDEGPFLGNRAAASFDLHSTDELSRKAFVASSPVMIAQERFSQFDRAAIEYGPKNCTRDVMRVVEYVDNILEHGE